MRNGIGVLLAGMLLQAGAARALTADEVVARNIEARGGAAKLAAVRSLRLTGTASFTFGDNKIDAEWAALQKRPGMVRTEISLQGLTAVDAFDGRDGWEVQPFSGRRDAHRTTADEAKDLQRNAEIGGPLAAAAEKGHRIEYLGTDDLDGTPAHKLRVTRKDGDVQDVFLDPDYFLEIRIVTETKVRGVERITETDLGGYEQVAGVWFPFSVESGEKGKPRNFRLTIQRAEPNVEADDALFRFPTGPVGRAVLAGPAPAQKPAAAAPPRSPRATKTAGPPSTWAPRAGACGSQATEARPSGPSSTRRRCSPSGPSRSIPPIRRRSGWAPANRGRATRSRSATASTSRPTAARPGPTWACVARSGSFASWCTRRTATWCTPAFPESCGATAPTAGSTRRPTVAAPGT